MGKVNGLSLCKRFMSLVASVMLMFSSLPGLAEDSEVEITSSTKVEDQMKGNPNELTKEEQQIQVQTVIQDIETARNEFGSKIQNSYYEWMDLNKSLYEGNLREIVPAYLLLHDDYHNVTLLKELIY